MVVFFSESLETTGSIQLRSESLHDVFLISTVDTWSENKSQCKKT